MPSTSSFRLFSPHDAQREFRKASEFMQTALRRMSERPRSMAVAATTAGMRPRRCAPGVVARNCCSPASHRTPASTGYSNRVLPSLRSDLVQCSVAMSTALPGSSMRGLHNAGAKAAPCGAGRTGAAALCLCSAGFPATARYDRGAAQLPMAVSCSAAARRRRRCLPPMPCACVLPHSPLLMCSCSSNPGAAAPPPAAQPYSDGCHRRGGRSDVDAHRRGGLGP